MDELAINLQILKYILDDMKVSEYLFSNYDDNRELLRA